MALGLASLFGEVAGGSSASGVQGDDTLTGGPASFTGSGINIAAPASSQVMTIIVIGAVVLAGLWILRR
jgi:hypothetical protein